MMHKKAAMLHELMTKVHVQIATTHEKTAFLYRRVWT